MLTQLSDLLRVTMQRMVSSVPLTDLVRKVTTHNSGSNLGELREMVDSLLGTYGFELKVFHGAASAFHQDVHTMRTEHRRLCVQGSPVDTVMNQRLNPETVQEVANMLRSNRESTLQVGPNRTASISQDQNDITYTQRAESGLANALTRLRSRRRGAGVGSGRHATTLTMMTTAEMNEAEPVVYGPRPVGVLGEAEHRGRLMSFQ